MRAYRNQMDLRLRPADSSDVEDLVELSLLAWEPVFPSFEHILGPEIYALIWPDWQAGQREAVETVCQDGDKTPVWVADVQGQAVGFVAYELNTEENTGTVVLLAVHPAYQNRGIGTELNTFALDKMRESGMRLAVVETGGDPSHAPARRSYEKAGYTALPLTRYFKDL